MNSNFNRQFLLTDYRLLRNRDFLQFHGTTAYMVYLVLRMFIWRGVKHHYMGLHELYTHHRLLVCSLTRDHIAKEVDIIPQNVSRHLTKLEKLGAVKIMRTGRQNIFGLGEWIDVHGDGSYRGLEWFYLDSVFGVSKDDIATLAKHEKNAVVSVGDTSEESKTTPQTSRRATPQGWRSATHNNREKKIDNSETVNVNGQEKNKKSSPTHPVKSLPELKQPKEKNELITNDILAQLGDRHSHNFYRLVASRIPESIIRQALAEIQADGAEYPARLFTHRMTDYARSRQQSIPKNKPKVRQGDWTPIGSAIANR